MSKNDSKQLVVPSGKPMSLFVKSSGSTSVLTALRTDSIESLVARVEQKSGQTISGRHFLSYGGKMLNKDLCLADYNIQSEATLNILPVLLGGGKILMMISSI